jgi:hypothetical protein
MAVPDLQVLNSSLETGVDACLRYALNGNVTHERAFVQAYHALLDALGRGLDALQHAECTRLLGPVITGALMPGGARVPGTSLELDPVHAAFNLGVMFAWGETSGSAWLDAERGVPSSCLAPVLAVADYRSRRALVEARPSSTMRDLAAAWIRAYELQQCLTPPTAQSDVRRGIRVASAMMAVHLMGGTAGQGAYAAWSAVHDRSAPHAEMHAWHRCWTAGDAASRGVRHALVAMAQPVELIKSLCDDAGGTDFDCEASRLPLGTRAFDGLSCRETDPEALARVLQRFEASVLGHYPPRQAERICTACRDRKVLEALPVHEFGALFIRN